MKSQAFTRLLMKNFKCCTSAKLAIFISVLITKVTAVMASSRLPLVTRVVNPLTAKSTSLYCDILKKVTPSDFTLWKVNFINKSRGSCFSVSKRLIMSRNSTRGHYAPRIVFLLPVAIAIQNINYHLAFLIISRSFADNMSKYLSEYFLSRFRDSKRS